MSDCEFCESCNDDGIEQERERIVALIDGATCHCEPDCDQLPQAKDLLALINLTKETN